MITAPATRPRILLSTVSSDSHTWNLVYLHLLLQEHGYVVQNLGATVPDELLVDTARRTQPDAIVISTVNGHGFLDGTRLIRTLRADAAAAPLPVVIGGKLGIAGDEDETRLQSLLDAGFDAAFTGSDAGALLDTLAGLTRPVAALAA